MKQLKQLKRLLCNFAEEEDAVGVVEIILILVVPRQPAGPHLGNMRCLPQPTRCQNCPCGCRAGAAGCCARQIRM